MHEPLIEIYDPEYYKEVFINHELYQRADVLYHEYKCIIIKKINIKRNIIFRRIKIQTIKIYIG